MYNIRIMALKHHKLFHWLIYLFLIVAFIGLIDSAYLAGSYYTGTPLSCGEISGCNEVAQSEYSKIAGVPLSTLGILYYAFAVAAAFIFLIKRRQVYATLLSLVTMLGFFASLYFIYVQVYLIEAICIYCMISAATSTVLFAIAAGVRHHRIYEHNN